jgi:hypothetical protein
MKKKPESPGFKIYALDGLCKIHKVMKAVRAKFNVAEITHYGNGGGSKVTLYPVQSGSEENKSF